MATAKKTKISVTKVEDGITLKLSKDEASVLRDILGGGIYGDGDKRELARGIKLAIEGAGIYFSGSYGFSGALNFVS